MTQPTDLTNRDFRLRVKLVSTDGEELPFKGFMLVPEDRLVQLEKLASAAQHLKEVRQLVSMDANQGGKLESAVKALDERLAELAKLWDIPK